MHKPTKPVSTRSIVLVLLAACFVPVSYMWYGALSNLDCGQQISASHGDASDKNCSQKASSHWAIFYGLNAMIYGVPAAAMVLRLKK